MKNTFSTYTDLIQKKINSSQWIRDLFYSFFLIALGLLISFLLTYQLDILPENFSIGSVAPKDIKADQNYEIVDAKSTQSLKDESTKSILPVYDFDSTVETNLSAKIHESFENARVFLAENSLFDNQTKSLAPELEGQLRHEFEDRLEINLEDSIYQSLRELQFDQRLERGLQDLLKEFSVRPIAFSLEDIKNQGEKGFVLRRLSKSEPYPETVIHDVSNFKTLNTVIKDINDKGAAKLSVYLSRYPSLRGANKALVNMAVNLIRVNVNYNSLETDIRKQRASENIKSVIIKIKRGESIIRNGDRFDAWHLAVIDGMRKARAQSNTWFKFAGIYLFVNLVLMIVYYYSARFIKKFKPNRKDLIFLGLSLVSVVLFLRLGVFIASVMRDSIPFSLGTYTLYYMLPVAAGAMLVRFVMNSETALIFSVIISLFAGIFLESNLELAVYYLLSSVFSAYVIANVDKRSAVLKAGFLTGLINAVTILSLHLISLNDFDIIPDWHLFLTDLVAGFLGGIAASLTVLSLTPFVESVFNYTTDIKLLELANMSHPLLKQMIVKAPGTYHHSQIVGILSEAGAQAIGANPLLARVASYYHDIGKMKKPQYYIENQRGENPHDKLVPTMSAIIIGAHVTDGIEMAKEYKLPQKIADMIPQHQGTKLIGFFYNKAKELAEKSGQEAVSESDFRYIGPKPLTKEAGIIMLADTVEAAVRSMPDKHPLKIKAMVEKLVNLHFVDQQLDECDLTLRDIHHIASAFVKILSGIYHTRIEYPEGALVTNSQNVYGTPKVQSNNLHKQSAPADSNVTHLFKHKDSTTT